LSYRIPVYEFANLSHADNELIHNAIYIANGQFINRANWSRKALRIAGACCRVMLDAAAVAAQRSEKRETYGDHAG